MTLFRLFDMAAAQVNLAIKLGKILRRSTLLEIYKFNSLAESMPLVAFSNFDRPLDIYVPVVKSDAFGIQVSDYRAASCTAARVFLSVVAE